MKSSALHGVTSLGIPDLLQSGPKNVAELAAATGSNEGGLYRVMRALASEGIFSENPQRTFSQTPMSEQLCSKAANSARDMVLWISDPYHLEVFREMSHSIRTGEIPEADGRAGLAAVAVAERLQAAIADADLPARRSL